jgi:hypothetical protein
MSNDVEIVEGIEFTGDEAPGAWPNGSRVRKATPDGEAIPLGARGTVMGSLGPFDAAPMQSPFAYFVEWEGWPGVVFFVRSAKLSLERPS